MEFSDVPCFVTNDGTVRFLIEIREDDEEILILASESVDRLPMTIKENIQGLPSFEVVIVNRRTELSGFREFLS